MLCVCTASDPPYFYAEINSHYTCLFLPLTSSPHYYYYPQYPLPSLSTLRIPTESPKWIVLDGDVDANWAESMNSVMDDNKTLTLASNERVPLKPYMRLIFEVKDLQHVTPATVSRGGVLYLSLEHGSQWRAVVGSWVRSRPDDLFDDADRERLHKIFERYFADTLKYFSSTLKGDKNKRNILITDYLRCLTHLLTYYCQHPFSYHQLCALLLQLQVWCM